jgi:hypothetical protein
MRGRTAGQGLLKMAPQIGVESGPAARDNVRWRSGRLIGART